MSLARSPTEAAKKIDVFTAIHWVSQAWQQVAAETIQKCFNKVGFKQFHQTLELS